MLTNFQWDQVSDGTPSAYFGTCISGFPNFFVLMGPNTVTGHLTVIYTVECQINFTIRVIAPIMKSLQKSPFTSRRYPDSVAVTAEAEGADNDWIQNKCKKLVWSTGCTSWFIDEKTGRNTQMYPDWQFLFWARSFWIPWQDLSYRNSETSLRNAVEKESAASRVLGTMTFVVFIAAAWAILSASLIGSKSFHALMKELS